MTNKDNLRQKAKKIRKTLDMKTISNNIVANIQELEAYKQAKHVMLFYPKAQEVDLRELLNDDKMFYLPRVSGDELEICPYKKNDELIVSDFGVLEPVSESVSKSLIDLVFVPALCVDEQCNRIGYGKGFYDRFLIDFKKTSIVVVPSELIFSEICVNNNDVCCDRVITQKKAT